MKFARKSITLKRWYFIKVTFFLNFFFLNQCTFSFTVKKKYSWIFEHFSSKTLIVVRHKHSQEGNRIIPYFIIFIISLFKDLLKVRFTYLWSNVLKEKLTYWEIKQLPSYSLSYEENIPSRTDIHFKWNENKMHILTLKKKKKTQNFIFEKNIFIHLLELIGHWYKHSQKKSQIIC